VILDYFTTSLQEITGLLWHLRSSRHFYNPARGGEAIGVGMRYLKIDIEVETK